MGDQNEVIREQVEALGRMRYILENEVGRSRELSLAITKIDEAVLWLGQVHEDSLETK